MKIKLRAKAIYELSRSIGVPMTVASEILERMAESAKKQPKVS